MLASRLAPEAQLLFLAAGGVAENDAIRRVADRGIDWRRLTLLADREKAAPVLWRRIGEAAPQRTRDPEAAPLQRLARVVHFKMEYLAQRVAETVAALDAAGIPCVLLKGAALASGVYASFPDRPMIDVDLMVEPGREREALAILLGAGWAWQSEKPRDADFTHLHHLPALLDARGMEMSLELHTSVLPPGHPFVLPPEALLESARRQGARVARPFAAGHVPEPHYLLVHSSIHLAWSHLFRQGAWRSFRDVAALGRRDDMDWAKLVELARSAHAATCCYWTLRLARNLCGVEVPARVLAALRPALPEPALRLLERHIALILLPTAISCPSIRLRRLMWSAAIQPRRSRHGAVRPWALLELLPEDRDRKARLGDGSSPPAAGWMDYWRAVLLAGSPSH